VDGTPSHRAVQEKHLVNGRSYYFSEPGQKEGLGIWSVGSNLRSELQVMCPWITHLSLGSNFLCLVYPTDVDHMDD
jgi:hypothetical protein